tara:strand:- start:6234 stop:6410 length:177 start_codon:yes stop_codon:yes gene_type:complete
MDKDNIVSVKKMEYKEEVVGYVMVKNGITSNVPIATDNTDYQAIQSWVADGNTIAEAD